MVYAKLVSAIFYQTNGFHRVTKTKLTAPFQSLFKLKFRLTAKLLRSYTILINFYIQITLLTIGFGSELLNKFKSTSILLENKLKQNVDRHGLSVSTDRRKREKRATPTTDLTILLLLS